MALKEIDLSVCGSTARAVVENLESLSNKLSHQNLVSCHNYTVNEETGYAYVELDYCPGGSLADLFKKQRRLIQQMPISQIWLIAAHLLSALSYLHFSYKHGGEVRCVTHGFITPESILLGPAGNAYLNIFSTDRITARLVEPVEQEIPLQSGARRISVTWVQSLQRWPDLLLRTFKPANSLVANLVCVVSSWHAVVLETYSVPLPQSSFCSTISRPRSVHSRRRHHDRRPARRARSLVSCGPLELALWICIQRSFI